MEQLIMSAKRSGAGRHVEFTFHRPGKVQTPRSQRCASTGSVDGRDYVLRTGTPIVSVVGLLLCPCTCSMALSS